MAIIKTERNTVYAYDPEPGDAFVEVTWHGPPDEGSRHLRAFGGRPQPVEQYQACVDWAVSMADTMAYPLHVVTTPADRVLTAERLDRAYASMSAQERGEFRRLANTIAAQVLRDCDDFKVRGAAYAVLAKTGVVDE
jgi:hypothetical protein